MLPQLFCHQHIREAEPSLIVGLPALRCTGVSVVIQAYHLLYALLAHPCSWCRCWTQILQVAPCYIKYDPCSWCRCWTQILQVDPCYIKYAGRRSYKSPRAI